MDIKDFLNRNIVSALVGAALGALATLVATPWVGHWQVEAQLSMAESQLWSDFVTNQTALITKKLTLEQTSETLRQNRRILSSLGYIHRLYNFWDNGAQNNRERVNIDILRKLTDAYQDRIDTALERQRLKAFRLPPSSLIFAQLAFNRAQRRNESFNDAWTSLQADVPREWMRPSPVTVSSRYVIDWLVFGWSISLIEFLIIAIVLFRRWSAYLAKVHPQAETQPQP